MKEIKIGIIGSRRRNEKEDKIALTTVLERLFELYESYDIKFVSGCCPKGGDRFAEELAKELGIEIILFPPQLDKFKNFRKAAYARNIQIAENSDELVAVVASDRTGGTEHTIKNFIRLKKKPVWLVE